MTLVSGTQQPTFRTPNSAIRTCQRRRGDDGTLQSRPSARICSHSTHQLQPTGRLRGPPAIPHINHNRQAVCASSYCAYDPSEWYSLVSDIIYSLISYPKVAETVSQRKRRDGTNGSDGGQGIGMLHGMYGQNCQQSLGYQQPRTVMDTLIKRNTLMAMTGAKNTTYKLVRTKNKIKRIN